MLDSLIHWTREKVVRLVFGRGNPRRRVHEIDGKIESARRSAHTYPTGRAAAECYAAFFSSTIGRCCRPAR